MGLVVVGGAFRLYGVDGLKVEDGANQTYKKQRHTPRISNIRTYVQKNNVRLLRRVNLDSRLSVLGPLRGLSPEAAGKRSEEGARPPGVYAAKI